MGHRTRGGGCRKNRKTCRDGDRKTCGVEKGVCLCKANGKTNRSKQLDMSIFIDGALSDNKPILKPQRMARGATTTQKLCKIVKRAIGTTCSL